MQNMIIQLLKVGLMLATMTIGFIFVGAFVEYKTLNGANTYAGMFFAFILYAIIAMFSFISIKEVLN